MKRLWIWVIFSLALHFLFFRFVSFQDEPFEQHEAERYEVTLLYYIPENEDVKKEKPRIIKKRKSVKKGTDKKIEEDIVEKEISGPDPQTMTLEKEQEEEPEKKEVSDTNKETEASSQELGKKITSVLPEREEPLDLTPVIEGLRERIIEELVYPYIARKKGLQGVVFVTLRLDENGNLLDIQITKSSGHKSLDNAAVQLVQKVVPYSHNLGKSLSLQIPIRYSLIN
ncbi:MAG: energy transducer TonB [Spirochaetota bacterium]|nr:MAG: energy transducer TonB [Spirochaetota bacterium]